MEEKTATIEERMAEIRLVNRAKWALIDKQGMTEQEAHRYIENRPWTGALRAGQWRRRYWQSEISALL